MYDLSNCFLQGLYGTQCLLELNFRGKVCVRCERTSSYHFSFMPDFDKQVSGSCWEFFAARLFWPRFWSSLSSV